MTTIVLLGIGISMLLYLGLGFWYGARVHGVGDMLPVLKGRKARVHTHREFAASTVAATISLATVVVAFFELVPTLGLWLLWTAVTTAAGLLVFAALAQRIWQRMAAYDYRPTLHSYLGTEFNSERLALVASVFTTLGYLSAFAVELTVGSRFLAGLISGVPQTLAVIVIAVVSFVYTAVGGFRAVVVTDRVQMWFIWLLLAALGALYGLVLTRNGWAASLGSIPSELRTLSWNNGLLPFVLGIAVMNLLTYVSNMGLWQRIGGSNDPRVVSRGMWSSVLSSLVSWSLLVIVSVGAFMVVKPIPGQNLLVTLLAAVQGTSFGKLVILCVVLGLYGAMLSTASTQLIAVSHTLYEDVFAPFRRLTLQERAVRHVEVLWSRLILVVSAAVSVAVVELLRAAGFTVADLAFAVYGAALGLTPPIVATLLLDRDQTRRLSLAAMLAVAAGFTCSWSAAAYGKAIGNGNLVFLSPLVSTAVATTIMVIGHIHAQKSALLKQPAPNVD